MVDFGNLAEIGLWILYISLPVLAIYIAYLILTKAFNYMGFSTLEAILIVFISFIFGFDIFILGVNISNIHLFDYKNWMVGINMGGALIPIFLSIYLTIKNKISLKNILIGIILVTIFAFFVTKPLANKGIVASFPLALLPAFVASVSSVFLSKINFKKAAPLAYISGTIGVLIGADFLHIWELLNMEISTKTNAIIGGADVFDMIYITGIIAVILDGVIMLRKKPKEKEK